MAKAPYGPLGPIRGSLGNLIFYTLNGQPIIRRKPQFIDKPSEAQLLVRSKITTLMSFLKKLTPFIKTGFINESRGTKRTYLNVATSYNLTAGLKIEEGRYVMDYPHAVLSTGKAAQPENATVKLSDNGLRFNWHVNPAMDWKTSMDQAMMLAYFPELNESIFEVSGARRGTGVDYLALPQFLMNKTMEIYLSFVSDDRLQVSNSLYLGRING